MSENMYKKAYRELNDQQRLAVDTIDGPVLVIAGPGTGKTQLLSTRIAHILETTDTLPENILCLTFTDAAAANMRDRLSGMIGPAAYNVTISTYHAFGNEILGRYPEFFSQAADLKPADELRIDQTLRTVQAALPYSNGLKHEVFIRDLKSLLSDYKQALLTPDSLRRIIDANEDFTEAASTLVREHIGVMPRITKASITAYRALLDSPLPEQPELPVESLAKMWTDSLREAVEAAEGSGKTSTLTAWKNRWLAKDGNGAFTVAGRATLRKKRAAADIYEAYTAELTRQGSYDYDDMILQAIVGLQTNPDLRYSLQERYQYVLLDEFQDTNRAQLRLVQLLTDNPVNEGRPNVLAVGDDDQAIFAFQGAHYSHMLDFYHHYRDTLVVPLTDNYRSGAPILELGESVSGQIGERLHHNFPAIDKTLTAAGKQDEPTVIERYGFQTDLAQNAWVAAQVKRLQDEDIELGQIAVLAPRHKHLEPLVPFLKKAGINVRYEKREDVLLDPAVTELLSMARLVVALSDRDLEAADSYWPAVLSLPFWGLPTSLIWQLSWNGKNWTEHMLEDATLRPIALFFIRLSQEAGRVPLETMLDYLSGVTALELNEADLPEYRSPFHTHYFGEKPQADEPVSYWQTLANLTVLRQRLRDYQANDESVIVLRDFLRFVSAHQSANIKILNTNPYQEADDAVHLMTAFKSKGMEFRAVILIAMNDEAWGSRARSSSSKIGIPENLKFISHAGATEDERLRLLFVAITRARTRLYLTQYDTTFSGGLQSPVKYLVDAPVAGDTKFIDLTPPKLEDLSVYWQQRHRDAANEPTLRALLTDRLATFQLSASLVTRFTETDHDGPGSVLTRDLLRFPSGSSLAGIYGDCIHETLSWLQGQLSVNKQLPTTTQVIERFGRFLNSSTLSQQDKQQLQERGEICLETYMAQRADMLKPADQSEYNFRSEGVFVGEAHLSGKIDRLIINDTNKTITVVDFKTGRSQERWAIDVKSLHRKQQLYFYKFLVEGSARFRGYTVTDAYLEFVEPDEHGLIRELHVKFDDSELVDFKCLVQAVWRHIKALDFPDVSDYGQDAKGSVAFQTDLINE